MRTASNNPPMKLARKRIVMSPCCQIARVSRERFSK
jgi:hypothetical protein